jgi:Protein tyrosine phosphatase
MVRLNLDLGTFDYCFQWLEKNTHPGLRSNSIAEVAVGGQPSLLEPHWGHMDIHKAPTANLCTYDTKGGKTKRINGNHLYYLGANGELVDSGMCRAQTPLDVKSFLSFLIKKDERETRSQHVFNLVTLEEQKKYPSYYCRFSIQSKSSPPILQVLGKIKNEAHKSFMFVHNLNQKREENSGIHNYTLRVEKFALNANIRDVPQTKIAHKIVHVTNYTDWPDMKAIDLKELDELVSKVIEAKVDIDSPRSPIIHCVAGKGRTGSLVAAVIIKESIKGAKNTLGINQYNYKSTICKLIVSLRNNGGGERFVSTKLQLAMLFNYAEFLFVIPKNKFSV